MKYIQLNKEKNVCQADDIPITVYQMVEEVPKKKEK